MNVKFDPATRHNVSNHPVAPVRTSALRVVISTSMMLGIMLLMYGVNRDVESLFRGLEIISSVGLK